jgi:hypothetical protein
MYPGSTQSGSSGLYSSYDYRTGYSGSLSRSYSYGRQPLDLPRPLEPRPTLQTSLSESSSARRHHEAPHGPVTPEQRSGGQNLPAIRDILSPAPHVPGSSSYTGIWNHNSTASSSQPRADSHYVQAGLHPPMALYPPSDLHSKYQPSHTGPFEVPILNTSPVAQHPPQSLAMLAYQSYSEPRRDYSENRPDNQAGASRSSYFSNSAPNQYAPTSADESQYRSSFGAHDQAQGPPYTPTGSDNRGSYVGVTDVPGEGTFYVYESGHRIPTHVDGEQVNPAWGLTKANKPRKRLALACLDCREKKIKCEPGTSSCLQCEKAKRICRR